MRLKTAKLDAQVLANRLKGGWLIVRTGIAGDYKIVPEITATPEDKKAARLTINPNYNIEVPVKARVRNYKARRTREIKKNENMRKTIL